MSRESLLPDVTVQNADISNELNSMIIGIFMMGMYTMIYFGTMFVCFAVKVGQSKVVLWAISLLYVCGMIEFSLNWVFLRWFFVVNGETRATVFASLRQLPRWLHLMNNLFAFLMLVLADGLLIWRCFNIWGRLWRVVLFPLFLYAVHIGLFVSVIIYLLVVKARPTHRQALTVDRIASAGYSISAATSLTTTFLIAYRIWALSKNGLSASSRQFKHTIEILVQSALVYSLALVIQAAAVPGTIDDTRKFALGAYAVAIFIPISGIAPTVMVARVSLSSLDSMWPTSNGRKPGTTIRFPTHQTSTSLDGTTRVVSECDAEYNASWTRP